MDSMRPERGQELGKVRWIREGDEAVRFGSMSFRLSRFSRIKIMTSASVNGSAGQVRQALSGRDCHSHPTIRNWPSRPFEGEVFKTTSFQ